MVTWLTVHPCTLSMVYQPTYPPTYVSAPVAFALKHERRGPRIDRAYMYNARMPIDRPDSPTTPPPSLPPPLPSPPPPPSSPTSRREKTKRKEAPLTVFCVVSFARSTRHIRVLCRTTTTTTTIESRNIFRTCSSNQTQRVERTNLGLSKSNSLRDTNLVILKWIAVLIFKSSLCIFHLFFLSFLLSSFFLSFSFLLQLHCYLLRFSFLVY